MRLPRDKVWRAFPVLDEYDDGLCERYVQEAMSQRPKTRLLVLATAPMLFLVWLIGTAAAFRVSDSLHGAGKIDVIESAFVAWVPPMLVVPLLVPIPFLVRDRWLRWAIRLRLSVMECPSCRYNVVGLEPAGESPMYVICPECGSRVSLSSEMLEQMRELGVV